MTPRVFIHEVDVISAQVEVIANIVTRLAKHSFVNLDESLSCHCIARIALLNFPLLFEVLEPYLSGILLAPSCLADNSIEFRAASPYPSHTCTAIAQ